MRYIALLFFAMLVVFASTAAFAQPAQISCPPGQGPMRAIGADGKLMTWCYPGGGPIGIAGMPPVRGYAQSCTQDSDCPGPFRCESGHCGRTNVGCSGESDCKYSEACDSTQQRCVPKGGHY